MGVLDVNDAKNHHRQHQHQPEHQMASEHDHVEVILEGRIGIALEPFEKRDAREIDGIGSKQGEQSEDRVKHQAQTRADRTDVLLFWRVDGRKAFVTHELLATRSRKGFGKIVGLSG